MHEVYKHQNLQSSTAYVKLGVGKTFHRDGMIRFFCLLNTCIYTVLAKLEFGNKVETIRQQSESSNGKN
jgi:hypothetical protein